MAKGNKTNHKKVYVRWSDWEAWLLKSWYPFKEKFDNDFPHMQADISWLKKIMLGLLIAVVAGAIAIIVTG